MKAEIKCKTKVLLLMLAVCMAAFFSASGYVQAASSVESTPEVSVKAKGAVVMDAKTGTILYSKNGNHRYYPASCTKLMTAMIALENCKDLSKVITVSHNAVYGIDPESSHIALEEGEKITMEQALYGLLLASANDAAVAIAENIAGSTDKFADLMNAKAKELGLTGSHFVDPHGLYDPEHYTTPEDLAKIMNADLKNPTFVKIFTTLKYTIPKTNKAKKRILYNNHRMIRFKYAYYPGVIGGKSGYVTKSKFNLVTVCKKNNMSLIVVVMRGNTADDMVKDTKKLLDHYTNDYQTLQVKPKADTVNLTCKKNVEVTHEKTMDIIVPKTASAADVTYKVTPADNVRLPFKKGTSVGTVTAVCNNRTAGTAALYASHSETDTVGLLIKILICAAIVIAILLILIALVRMHRKSGRKRRRSSSAGSRRRRRSKK